MEEKIAEIYDLFYSEDMPRNITVEEITRCINEIADYYRKEPSDVADVVISKIKEKVGIEEIAEEIEEEFGEEEFEEPEFEEEEVGTLYFPGIFKPSEAEMQRRRRERAPEQGLCSIQ